MCQITQQRASKEQAVPETPERYCRTCWNTGSSPRNSSFHRDSRIGLGLQAETFTHTARRMLSLEQHHLTDYSNNYQPEQGRKWMPHVIENGAMDRERELRYGRRATTLSKGFCWRLSIVKTTIHLGFKNRASHLQMPNLKPTLKPFSIQVCQSHLEENTKFSCTLCWDKGNLNRLESNC